MAAPKENHCPFACPMETLDDLGYCPHLVGFSNDGKTFEPVQKRSTDDSVTIVNGRAMQEVKGKDKLVNPEFQQLDNGVWHTAKRWVSSRVYRKVQIEEPARAG